MLPERWILAIADDLTGALEAGSKFAAHGMEARVTCDAGSMQPSVPVFVIDTETRHLPGSRAAEVMHAVGTRMAAHHPWLVYKKTDSTLRGNIADELSALSAAFPNRELVYVPAYPAMGRTVRSGRLFVDGVPVHETEFAADPLNPIRDSSVQSAIGDVRASILDGESDDDIREAARRICASAQPLIVAGPAAIAGALAEERPLPCRSIPAFTRVRRCLIVNGSMHPVSRVQVKNAALDGDWRLFEYVGKETGVERALRLGESVRQWLNEHPVDALMVFGGDTAHGIHRALGAPAFDSLGEVLPGVPVSQTGELYWITKAGGFGPPNLIEELRRTLSV
jgi:uncharacterized protein YgbK (DUF1537 family)